MNASAGAKPEERKPGTSLTARPAGWLLHAMTEPPQKPATTPRADAAHKARLEREAAALRENLRRRKEQARARTPSPEPLPKAN